MYIVGVAVTTIIKRIVFGRSSKKRILYRRMNYIPQIAHVIKVKVQGPINTTEASQAARLTKTFTINF